jgi:hypothetical protein
MPIIDQDIQEIDVVSFKEAVGQWPPGTEGTVVLDFGDRKMVEISNDAGEALDLPVVPVTKLKLVQKYS